MATELSTDASGFDAGGSSSGHSTSKTIPVNLTAPLADIRFLVERALIEDLTPLGDLTSSLLDSDLRGSATFAARRKGVLSGCVCVNETFTAVDARLQIQWLKVDGDRVEPGEPLAIATGPFASLLTAERTALNFLSALSGVATNAARWIELAGGRVKVWDTRKTTPGYRSLQKAAVRAGGAYNHRGNLSDWIMLKDNHLWGTTITEAVAESKRRWPGRTVHVEVDREDQLKEALAAQADIVLLDNFTPDELKSLVALVDALTVDGGRRPLLEASGGITLDTLDAYADTGVDLVSSGSITNSAPVLDVGLDVVVEG